MSAFISRKQSLLILLASLGIAAAAALLLNQLLAGPRLGPLYDFLRDRRSGAPVSREITLIDTGELVEAGDLFTVLMTLIELDASGLVVEVPVLGHSLGRTATDEEIRRRFNDEYTLLGNNIRNLFEAIRVGSVPPQQSAAYVENLVELAERGRDRLTAALIRQDGGDSVQAASIAFGSVLEAMDLRSKSAIDDGPWYARPRPDRDGRLRRIAPLLRTAGEAVIEHIVYRSLKPRWEESAVEYTEQGPVLVNRKSGGGESRIPLDKNGNILIEKPREGERFLRLSLEWFQEYREADCAMGRLLEDAETLGIYSQTIPERIPLILRDYATSLWEELLKAPEEEKRAAWLAARAAYLAGLEELLYGPAEMTLVGSYEEIIATEKLGDEGLAKLQGLRNELIQAFVAMREQQQCLIESRNLLAEALTASLCIMGPSSEAGPVESSALLANTLLTSSHIIPEQNRYILFWSLAAVFVILLCIHTLRPMAALVTGLFAALLCAAGFGWSFVISAYWIDPFIPAGSCLAGTLVIVIIKFAMICWGARRFRYAYGPAVHKACLKELIRAGRPLLSEINTVPAAVIAVKYPGLYSWEDRETPAQAVRAAVEFRKVAALAFKQAGAAIISYEGDTVLACFGSPPERICRKLADAEIRDNHHPALKAADYAAALLRAVPGHENPSAWHFGIDYGECAFSWSEETGYTANGRPVVRSRFLSALAAQRNAGVLVTDTVLKELKHPARKIRTAESGGMEIYELPLRELH
jgi:class 3 adenylate cyclase